MSTHALQSATDVKRAGALPARTAAEPARTARPRWRPSGDRELRVATARRAARLAGVRVLDAAPEPEPLEPDDELAAEATPAAGADAAPAEALPDEADEALGAPASVGQRVPPVPPVPGPAAAPTMTHRTTFRAPDGSANTRTDVGVGEVVTFTGSAAGAWAATGGTPAARRGAARFRWTAPNRAAAVTVTLTVGAARVSETMNVIEPSSIRAGKVGADHGFAAGVQGAGMSLRFRYFPMRVSFGNVESKEVSGPASDVRGYFSTYAAAALHHNSGDTFFPIRADNRDSAIDTASFSGYPSPWTRGRFQWHIPNHFKVKTEGGGGKRFTTVTQAFRLEGAPHAGRSTVRKAGQATAPRMP